MSEAGPLPAPAGALTSLLAAGTHALTADGDLVAGRERFEAAYREAERVGDAGAIAAAALGLGGLWVHEQRTLAGSAQLRARLRHALSLVDPNSSVALQLRVRLAGEADYRTGRHDGILTVLDEARSAEDPMARAEALSLAHHCVLGPDHGPLRRALATELVEESFRTGRRSDLLMGLLWQTVDLFLDGDPQARRRLGELRAMLAERDHLAVGFVAGAIEVMLAVRAGRFAEAEKLAIGCAERGATAGDVDWSGWFGGQLFAIRWYQGRVGELLPMLGELVHSPTLSAVDSSYFAALAVAAAAAGDRPTATATLATLCRNDLTDLPRSSTWLVTMSGIAEAAHLLGDGDVAARVYETVLPYAHLPTMVSLGVACFGSTHHTLGVAAMTAGDADRAAGHLREAIRANLALMHWPAVTASRAQYARALRMRNGPGDAEAATLAWAAAREEAAVLGLAIAEPLADLRPVPAGPAVRAGGAAMCVRTGESWRIEWGGRTTTVGHSVGMAHLAALVGNPGVELHAAELAGGPGTAPRLSGQPVLDDSARLAYRDRLARLGSELDELDENAEHERADAVRAERDWVITELAAATGLAGRTRRFPDEAERARIAVGKAIRRTLARIHDADRMIGAHLRDAVRTGMRCSYRP
ncbi:MAG TPA: hypothetical protein VGP26_26505 [Actinophytocola sp.]|nr:hypothetical protein [Actinophytocola sp.]